MGFVFAILLFAVFGVFGHASPLKKDAGPGTEILMPMADGKHIRVVSWNGAGSKAPTIVLLQGRSSFVEKNLETVGEFLGRGYNVWTFDWRGQGGSDRLLPNPQKTHIDDYDTYLSDLHYIMKTAVLKSAKGPVVLVGLSMGGHVALRYSILYPGEIDGAVLISPMIAVKTGPFPFFVAQLLVRSATLMGFDTLYAAGYGDYDPKRSIFETNTNTHDAARFERNKQKTIDLPRYVTAGPTYGWIRATFRSIDALSNSPKLDGAKMPILMVSAGDDRVVDTAGDGDLCARLPQCRHHTITGSFHNIPNEIDTYRLDFWRQFDGYMTSF